MLNRRDFITAGVATLGIVRVPAIAGAQEGRALLGFVGDLLTDRAKPIEAYEPVLDLLRGADVLFGNLEGPYSDDPDKPPHPGFALVPEAYNLDVYSQAGFDVLSLANNHIIDGGHSALLETRRLLNAQGVATAGAGANIAEAREPALVGAAGTTIAYLAYASVFPVGYAATPFSAGLAPLRARNHYAPPFEGYHTPGADPVVSTVPVTEDHEALTADIEAARDAADLVIVSFHWGDHLKPFHLTDHETRTGRLCIDAGADIVVGHHQHVLRGMEWYKGKPIYYGLGHFVFDIRLDKWPQELFEGVEPLDDESDYYGVAPRKGWPLMPLHREARMTAMAYAKTGAGRVDEIGFVPCRLNPAGVVRAVDPATSEGREVVDYVQKGCASQGINGRVDTGGYVDVAGFRGVRILPLEA